MATELGFDIILLGAPAAGKDTQAEILMRHHKFKAVESGKHWRKMAARKDANGELLRTTFSKGHPAPVWLMKKFLVKELKAVKNGSDLLFIGNPRLKPEALLLVKLLNQKKHDFLAISIDLPVAEIKKRSLKRMRDDQDWKYVDNRIRMYKLQVSKTINYFKSLGKLKTVNGNRSIQKVAKDIEKIINDHKRRQAAGDTQKKRANTGRSVKPGRK